jgi:hypothetical protein
MPLNLTVPDEIACAAEQAARVSGATAEQLLLEALQVRFPPPRVEPPARPAYPLQYSDSGPEQYEGWEGAD